MDLSLKCQSDWICKLTENKGKELEERAGLVCLVPHCLAQRIEYHILVHNTHTQTIDV